jgi:tetratricopeptide (TPR) repeat protein
MSNNPSSSALRTLNKLSPRDLRATLRALHATNMPSKLPLVEMQLVRSRIPPGGAADSATLRRAIRAVILEAVDRMALEGESDEASQRQRSHIILKEQYLNGKPRDVVANMLFLEHSAYHVAQARALEELGALLNEWEATFEPKDTIAEPIASSRSTVPFLAPPRPPYRIIGRDDMLRDLKRHLMSGESVAISAISGLPGVGKTALAIELANDVDLLSHFKDGILWAGLGREPDAIALLGSWCGVLKVPTNTPGNDRVATLASAIHAAIGLRYMLLIIDDAWNAQLALQFRLGGPNCAHLLTTRSPQIASSFANKSTMVISELEEQSSRALLSEFASGLDATEMTALVHGTGGLPLALALIGKQLGWSPVAASSRRKQQTITLLSTVRARMELEHIPSPLEGSRPSVLTLEEVIDLSGQAVEEHTRAALYALSVFPPKPNTFSEDAAVAICNQPAEVLDELVDVGLIEVYGDRYALHQTIHDYASLRLADVTVWHRMGHYFADFLETHSKDYVAIQTEYDNIAAALHDAKARGLQKVLIRAVMVLQRYLTMSVGVYDKALYYIQSAIEAAQDIGDRSAEANLLIRLSRTLTKTSGYAEMDIALNRAHVLAQLIQEPMLMADVLAARAFSYLAQGALDEASANLDLALENLSGDESNPELLCSILANSGQLARTNGDSERAQTVLERAASIARRYELNEWLGRSHYALGCVYLERGDIANSDSVYRMALAESERVQSLELKILALDGLTACALEANRLAQASEWGHACVAFCEQIGYHEVLCNVTTSLAKVSAKMKHEDEAIKRFERVRAVAQTYNLKLQMSAMLPDYGAFQLSCDRVAEAQMLFDESRTLSGAIGDQESLARSLYGLARIAALNGQMGVARQLGTESLQTLREAHHKLAEEVGVWLDGLAR